MIVGVLSLYEPRYMSISYKYDNNLTKGKFDTFLKEILNHLRKKMRITQGFFSG